MKVRASATKISFTCVVLVLLIAGMTGAGLSSEAGISCTQTGWYFAEGFTGGDFDTWILIQNPNALETTVHLKFMKPVGEPVLMDLVMAGETRKTIYLNSVPGLENTEVATTVTCDSGGIVAERAMYFNYELGGETRAGGHAAIGAPNLNCYWYLPEGCTRGSFNTYVLLMNPNPDPASVEVKLMLPEGGQYYRFHLDMPAECRRSIRLNDLVWTEGAPNTIAAGVQPAIIDPPAQPRQVSFDEKDVSVWVLSDKPIVAEHSLYYDYYGKQGGSSAMGLPATSGTWYLPEGYTGPDFDTYVLVQNPSGSTANVTFSFYTNPPSVTSAMVPQPPVPAGITQLKATVGPWARYTLRLNDVPELTSREVATRVDSDVPIVAERSMYFTYGTNDDGDLGGGSPYTYTKWYLAEGYTGAAFDTYVLFMNPFGNWQKVTATFMTPSGEPVVKDYMVAPYCRVTIHVDEIPGLENTDVSTSLVAQYAAPPTGGAVVDPPAGNAGIVAERAMYFSYDGKAGGSCSIGFGQ